MRLSGQKFNILQSSVSEKKMHPLIGGGSQLSPTSLNSRSRFNDSDSKYSTPSQRRVVKGGKGAYTIGDSSSTRSIPRSTRHSALSRHWGGKSPYMTMAWNSTEHEQFVLRMMSFVQLYNKDSYS